MQHEQLCNQLVSLGTEHCTHAIGDAFLKTLDSQFLTDGSLRCGVCTFYMSVQTLKAIRDLWKAVLFGHVKC